MVNTMWWLQGHRLFRFLSVAPEVFLGYCFSIAANALPPKETPLSAIKGPSIVVAPAKWLTEGGGGKLRPPLRSLVNVSE